MKFGIYLWLAFIVLLAIPVRIIGLIFLISIVCGIMGRDYGKNTPERRISQQGDQTNTGA